MSSALNLDDTDTWDWDEDFLQVAIEAENIATASSSGARANGTAPFLSAVALSATAIPAVASTAPPASANAAPPFVATWTCNPVSVAGSSSRTDEHLFIRPRSPPCASLPPIGSSRPATVISRSEKDDSFQTHWDLASYGIGGAGAADCVEGFSPPRELSQRVPEPGNLVSSTHESSRTRRAIAREKEKEIERLKSELRRVSNRLTQLEQERSEIQKERAKNDAQLKSAFSQIEAKDAEIKSLKSNLTIIPKRDANKDTELTVEITAHHSLKGSRNKRKEALADGSFGVNELKRRTTLDNNAQTSGECTAKDCKDEDLQTKQNASSYGTYFIPHSLSAELSTIWGSSFNGKLRRNLISKLFATCSEDICALFKCIGIEMSLSTITEKKLSGNDKHLQQSPNQPDSAVKISKFCTKLMKMNKEMIPMDDLLEALSQLFVLDITIVHRSLHILKVILQMVSSWDIGCSKRKNIITAQSKNSIAMKPGSVGPKLSEAYTFVEDEEDILNHMCISTSLRIMIVNHMRKILQKNNDQLIQLEALSIIHLLTIGSDPFVERETIGLITFKIFPKLLHMDVGPHVQRQAVEILFLLLNCLKLLTLFCTGFKDFVCQEEIDDQKNENQREIYSFEEASVQILKGLVDCIKCGGDSVAELKLQMEVVNVLAFIAASGEHGFNIMLRPVSSEEHNFLDLIIQVLAHQMDQEDNGMDKSIDICKERIALRREALILLNRLASNSYSMHTLGTLTRTYLSAGLVIDVADRISHRQKGRWKYGSMKSLQTMDDETIDLAGSFVARVLAFIGE